MKVRSFVLLILLLALGCEDDKKFEPVYQVPAELEPIIDKFLSESRDRGFSYQITNLIIKYDENLKEPVCGTCNEASKENNIQKVISIKSGFVCWTNDQELEVLIFHELGHCFLGRQHLSDTLPNGAPKSIMIPNENSLYSPCVYALEEDDCNKRYRRKYYVDELFDESTPVPDWAN